MMRAAYAKRPYAHLKWPWNEMQLKHVEIMRSYANDEDICIPDYVLRAPMPPSDDQ